MAARCLMVLILIVAGCGGGPQPLPGDDDNGGDDDATQSPTPTPYPPESACTDAFDNDQDGLTDCDDPDCDLVILTGGACTNEADQLALCTTDINTVLQDCANNGGCGTDANCYGTCMAAATNVSATCSGCFGQMAACVGTTCIWDCFDPNSTGCQNCVATNCWPLVESCGGTLACPGAICN